MLLLALLATGKDRGRPKKGPADEAMSTARSLSIEQLAAPRDMRIPVSRIDDTLVTAYYFIPPEATVKDESWRRRHGRFRQFQTVSWSLPGNSRHHWARLLDWPT